MVEVPDVSMMPELVELCLDFCFNLVKIHDSVGRLKKLRHFSAVACLKLKEFPVGKSLKSLKLLNLSVCRSITKFSDVSQSKYLERLHLSDTSIDVDSISILDMMKFPNVVLPGVRVPRYFHHRTDEESISFLIRREFPALSVSFALSTNEDLSVELRISIGRFKATLRKGNFLSNSSYVLIFNLPSAFTEEDYLAVESEILEGWVQVELFGVVTNGRSSSSSSRDEMRVGVIILKVCGVFVCNRESSRNISFSDPYPYPYPPGSGMEQSEEPLRMLLGSQHSAKDSPVISSSYFLNTVKRLLKFKKRKASKSREMWKSKGAKKGMIREVDEDEDENEESFWMQL